MYGGLVILCSYGEVAMSETAEEDGEVVMGQVGWVQVGEPHIWWLHYPWKTLLSPYPRCQPANPHLATPIFPPTKKKNTTHTNKTVTYGHIFLSNFFLTLRQRSTLTTSLRVNPTSWDKDISLPLQLSLSRYRRCNVRPSRSQKRVLYHSEVPWRCVQILYYSKVPWRWYQVLSSRRGP